jgi:RNA polymerase sigma-70 factor (ECF subfamily)
LSESLFIQQARAGDAGAWEALTRLHQEPVFRFAYLLLGDPDDAKDITQETFVRAFYRLGAFEAGRPMRPWLLRIASRVASNRRRSLGRYLEALRRLAYEPAVDHSSEVAASDAEELWAAVRRLRPPFQQVIYLRFFLELSEDETAAALNVPAGTVKSRLHRALHELRELIAREYLGLQETFAA